MTVDVHEPVMYRSGFIKLVVKRWLSQTNSSLLMAASLSGARNASPLPSRKYSLNSRWDRAGACPQDRQRLPTRNGKSCLSIQIATGSLFTSFSSRAALIVDGGTFFIFLLIKIRKDHWMPIELNFSSSPAFQYHHGQIIICSWWLRKPMYPVKATD